MSVASQNNVSDFLEQELDKLAVSDQQKSAMKEAAKAITQPASPESSKTSQEIFYHITKSTSRYVEDLTNKQKDAKNILLADLQSNGLIDEFNTKQSGIKPQILDKVSRNKNPLLFTFADCLIGFVSQIPEKQDADSFHKIFSTFADLANGEQDLVTCAAKLEELKQSLDTKDVKAQDAENSQQTEEGLETEENPDSEDPAEAEKRKKQQERESYILFAATNLLDLIKSLLMSGKTIEEEQLEAEKKKKEEENEILNAKLNGAEDKNKSALGALLKFLTGMLAGKASGMQTSEQASGGGGSGSEDSKSQEAEKNTAKSEEIKAENQATVEAAKAETSNQTSNQLSDTQATSGSTQEAQGAQSLQQSFEGVKAVFDGIINTIEAQMQAMQTELQNTKTAFQTLDNATLASQAALANESQAVANQNSQQQSAGQNNTDSQQQSGQNNTDSQSTSAGQGNSVVNMDIKMSSFTTPQESANSTKNHNNAMGGIRAMLDQVVGMIKADFNQATTTINIEPAPHTGHYTPDTTSPTETRSSDTDATKSSSTETKSSDAEKPSNTETRSTERDTKSPDRDTRSDSKPADARSSSTEKSTTREAFSSGLEKSFRGAVQERAEQKASQEPTR